MQNSMSMIRNRLNPMLLCPNDLNGYIEVLVNIVFFLGLLGLASMNLSIWSAPFLVVSIGIAIHRLFFPLHDCLHYSLFQSRIVNTFFGYLLAALIGTAFKPFQDQHLKHHRYFATPEDPGAEDYQVRFTSRRELVVFLLSPLLGGILISRLIAYLRRSRNLANNQPSGRKPFTRLSVRLLALVIVVVIQSGICALVTSGFHLTELWRYPVFVILPGVTVFLFLNRLRMFIEHVSDDLTVHKPVTRTITSQSLALFTRHLLSECYCVVATLTTTMNITFTQACQDVT
jgi:fatty acid desaturase